MAARRKSHPTGSVVELRIPARLALVHLARAFVAAVAQASSSPLGDRRIDDLRLVVSEACTNAVEAHALLERGGRPGRDDTILVRCHLLADGVDVEVVDHGPGLPSAVMAWVEATPVVPPSNGLGLYLMRTVSDTCQIRSDASGTTACVRFRSTPAAA